MRVLFVAAEASPFVKTGGLADVIGSLPKEMLQKGIDIRIILPKYGTIPYSYKKSMVLKNRSSLQLGSHNYFCGIEELKIDGLTIYFIDNEHFYKRPKIYGYWDDGERYAFFCRAVLESLSYLNFKPDIIHCHDWHTAMTVVLLKNQYHIHPFYKDIKSVFTIHNLQYQGVFPKEILNIFGLGSEYFDMEKLEFYGKINYMKGGIVYADTVTTVSNSYAEEIKTPERGEKLDGVMRKYSNKLHGIINGIDNKYYNPAADCHIFKQYDKNSLDLKLDNKLAFQKILGLPQRKEVPMFGLVSRLVNQKGLNLIENIMEEFLKEDVQFVLLGTGEEYYEKYFRKMAAKYPKKFSANILFDEKIAHRIYAASDFFLMPSLFEPCGLGQLIALRYGTVPIVRQTGGLKDTIEEFNEFSNKGNGFVFKEYNGESLLNTIKRALLFYQNQSAWKKLRANLFNYDFSWEKSAKKYIELYNAMKISV